MRVFSDISLWWLLPWAIFALGIAVLYYRHQKMLEDASKAKKWLMTGLRAFSLFILGILLFGLIVESKEYKSEKPLFITLVDNSMSMLNYADSSKVAKQIDELEAKLKEKYGERFDFRSYIVGENISDSTRTYLERLSDLDKGFDFIYNKYYNRNIGGICFISDGNFNAGKNPIYSAEKISLTPVFSLGVGDTVVKRDQLIRNVAVNEVAFLNNDFPLEIDLEAHKMGKGSSTVSVWSEGTKIAEQQVNYTDGSLDFNHVSFVLSAKKVGFINYSVRLKHESKESSYENNEKRFYVEVIDSRSKILLLAQAPHPDLTAISQVIQKDQNAEVESVLLSEWKGKFSDYELVIWHEPGKTGNDATIAALKASNVPVWLLLTAQSSGSQLKKFNMGVEVPSSGSMDEVQASALESFQLFELSEELKRALKNYPPLNVRFGNARMAGGEVLITQRVGPVEKKEPLLAFKTEGNAKFGVLFGEGLWRWKISDYVSRNNNTLFDELIQKTIQFLTVKRNTEPLRVQLPNRFNVIEDVLINAEFYNSSFERINEPSISLTLTDDKGVDIRYEFAKTESAYTLSLGRLKEGRYTWKAGTTFNGKRYEKSGSFVVEDVAIEALSTHANHNLLKQIAEKTNGSFYKLAHADELLDELDLRKDIVNVSYEESTFDDLIDWKILFLLLLLSLTGEWFLRRYSGSY